MKLDSLKSLYVEQLKDIYNAEKQMAKALPKMIEKTSHSELKKAFEEHLQETENQAKRLEKIFDKLGESPSGEKCDAMEGLIKEGEKLMKKEGDPDVIDAGLIASAQRIEHYEIAGYGCVKTYAEMLGEKEAADMLSKSLDEESNADKKLNKIALEVVNQDAEAHH